MLIQHIVDDVAALSRILQMEIALTETNEYVSNVGRVRGAPMLQCVIEYKKEVAVDLSGFATSCKHEALTR